MRLAEKGGVEEQSTVFTFMLRSRFFYSPFSVLLFVSRQECSVTVEGAPISAKPSTARSHRVVLRSDDPRRRACLHQDRPAPDPRSIAAASPHRASCLHASDRGHRFPHPLRSCDSRRSTAPTRE